MIKAVYDKSELYSVLDKAPDIYTEKIRSFAEAYGTGYPFCRFYICGSAALCAYYGDVTVAGEITDAEELSLFLTGSGFKRLLMPQELFTCLDMHTEADELCLMQWAKDVKMSVDYDKEDIETDVPIGQIYEIAASGFDIDYDTWYTDISHMLRHGVASVYSLESASCVVKMFSSNGITYLSYICTLPERRGEGLAKRLLHSVCTEEALKGNKVYLFCERELEEFYISAGFLNIDTAAQITIGTGF